MPKQYESIRNQCAGKAKKDSPKYNQCQSKAAAIYNSQQKKAGKPSLAQSMNREKKKFLLPYDEHPSPVPQPAFKAAAFGR